METLAPISEHEETVSDRAFAAKGLYSAQNTEEIVSWIRDFSYIYSADALGLDDSRSREEDVYLHKKRLPDVSLSIYGLPLILIVGCKLAN